MKSSTERRRQTSANRAGGNPSSEAIVRDQRPLKPLGTTALERQLLLQLGERLKSLRKQKHLSMVEMARMSGISRSTLASVEAGDPRSSMGSYLRVMSVLGVQGELALIGHAALQSGPSSASGDASLKTQAIGPVVVSADESRHRIQDLQSLVLHEEAVRLVRSDPVLLGKAMATLDAWIDSGPSRSMPLWREWQDILKRRAWRKVLAPTQRAQMLRQASPLTTVLPNDVRLGILAQVRELKKGIVLGQEGGK